MEILAPVNTSTLEAALEAGADAVYFGLKRLNARRGAKNFTQGNLADAVKRIHQAGAKAHLTVNINLTTRATGLAARTLQLAAEAGVDAVIVRDPAILALKKYFPSLEFHLSTQAGVSSSAGVRFASSIGCSRAVLAREMTADEIKAACQVPDIDIEVFIQGAMCFCASGHCLLSSWVGGRSGNRGACASPCRVAWRSTVPDAVEAHPMSMHDLCLLSQLRELEAAGAASLKIEGRLKAPGWVRRAVTLYRHAAEKNADIDAIRKEAAE
ncbi:MAG: U32 family peptidase, partial [Victivallales bacterium]|nr:U32 family peptidase [Victivallales bacterium]